MRERHYKLDKTKTIGIKPANLANEWKIDRRRVWSWLQGINCIPETYFNKLLNIVNKQPTDLLAQESLEFFINSSI